MPDVIKRVESTFYPLRKRLAGKNVRDDQILIYPKEAPLDASNALYCIGTFDGVHKGHQMLIQKAKMVAQEMGLPLIVATFNPRPKDILNPGSQPYIISRAASVHYLLQAGANAVLIQKFTKEFSQAHYETFLDKLKNSVISMAGLYIGENLRIGNKAHAGIEEIKAYAQMRNLPFFTSELLDIGGQPVSSSRIRLAIASGDLPNVYKLLNRDFFVEGEVIHGKGEGKKFGFATANLAISQESALVPEGVYAGYALVNATIYPAAINVGTPKSFPEQLQKHKHFLEAHLLGFDEDIYGEVLSVAPIKILRQPKAFKSIDELKLAVQTNLHETEKLVGSGLIAKFV